MQFNELNIFAITFIIQIDTLFCSHNAYVIAIAITTTRVENS